MNQKGITNKELSKRTGINVTVIRRLKQTGCDNCRSSTLRKLVKGLDITVSEIRDYR
ncbi:helix-turn-helix transcriptional regulator [Gemella sanguinis]|uniref:helix-turn-helix domain-containing protein n=1 Tax=Gemella sanguinis TaxID=84135 RepID=UPI00352EB05D